jgi:hypothetical protein
MFQKLIFDDVYLLGDATKLHQDSHASAIESPHKSEAELSESLRPKIRHPHKGIPNLFYPQKPLPTHELLGEELAELSYAVVEGLESGLMRRDGLQVAYVGVGRPVLGPNAYDFVRPGDFSQLDTVW